MPPASPTTKRENFEPKTYQRLEPNAHQNGAENTIDKVALSPQKYGF